MRKIFLNEFGRLRSGWRVFIFSCAFLAISFLFVMVLRVIYAVLVQVGVALRFNVVANLIFHITTLVAALGGGYFCARLLDALPWPSLGLTFLRRWVRDLLVVFTDGFAALPSAV